MSKLTPSRNDGGNRIREAIREWIIRHKVKQWPKSILNFKGYADAPSFESFRDDLLPPDDENPLT